LGRPPRDAEIKRQLSADQQRRNEVEGCCGSGKRKYSLDLIMARLPKGAESTISMAIVVMCAEKIRRLLRLFVVAILAWFCSRQWPRCLRISLKNNWKLGMADSLAAV
jgi:IS5 family transposase